MNIEAEITRIAAGQCFCQFLEAVLRHVDKETVIAIVADFEQMAKLNIEEAQKLLEKTFFAQEN